MSRREAHLDAMLRHLGAAYYQTLQGQATAADVAQAVIKNRLANVRFQRIEWAKVRVAAGGLSHAEITLAAERAAKDVILAKRDALSTSDLVSALRERHAQSSATE